MRVANFPQERPEPGWVSLDDPPTVEQFYWIFSSSDSRLFKQGEKNLTLTVLKDAVNCFFKRGMDGGTKKLQKDAEEWISSSDHFWPFSFENICFAVGLDPSYLRLGLRKMERKVEEHGAIKIYGGEVVRAWCSGCHADVDVGLVEVLTAKGIWRRYECRPAGHRIKR